MVTKILNLLAKARNKKGSLRPDDVNDDDKLCRTIKIVAVSKFIKEIVRMAANLNNTKKKGSTR